MITQEQLMSYVDGEASAETRAEVEAALAADETLRRRIAEERRLRRHMANLYAPALTEPVPDRLTGLFRGEETNVVAFKRPNPAPAPSPSPSPWRWLSTAAAVAASLVLGVFVGQQLDMRQAGAQEASMLRAQGTLATALQTELASSQSAAAPIRIGISFTGPDGQPCRTVETADAAGLACRSDGEWRLALLASTPSPRASEYQQAGSAAGLVMSAAQEMIVGEPMSAAQERQARDAGWPRDAR
jgi:hypothetical protein